MWKKFLIWLLNFALQQLGADIDAESEKLFEDYKLRRAAVEKAREAAETEIENVEQERLTLVAKRKKNSAALKTLVEQIAVLDQDLEKLKNEKDEKIRIIRIADDDTLLHSEL